VTETLNRAGLVDSWPDGAYGQARTVLALMDENTRFELRIGEGTWTAINAIRINPGWGRNAAEVLIYCANGTTYGATYTDALHVRVQGRTTS
jgi:hypothetical protein